MSKKPKKKKPKKKARRLTKAERAQRALRSDQETLARMEPGGTPERPLDVPSPSVVESRAIGLGCVYCEGEVKLRAHEAEKVGAQLLRRIETECGACGGTREVWVRASPVLN